MNLPGLGSMATHVLSFHGFLAPPYACMQKPQPQLGHALVVVPAPLRPSLSLIFRSYASPDPLVTNPEPLPLCSAARRQRWTWM